MTKFQLENGSERGSQSPLMSFAIGSTAWRIVRADYEAMAMDGEGAFRYGGRWNSAGTRIVYLAETRALAAMEIMIHVDRVLLSVPYIVIPIEFDVGAVQDPVTLPDNWDNPVASESTRLIGDQWVQSQSSLLLRVPSVVVPGEWNYLLNPAHPELDLVNIGCPEPFYFDSRLS